ncbi:MAG: ankyrin repeat domain-containing protein kinase [Pseudomonadota bacterium]|nr:ankyrin repeat domain-containing protein kinase [Pseudomonadota bacterium]
MQQDRGDTSAQIKDQIEQLIAKMQQIETAGLSLTLDARGYTKTCRDKTIEKLKSISSDDPKEVIKELEIIKTQPEIDGQLNTYKIYRDNKDENDRSIEFFYNGEEIQLLISYSKQKDEAVAGRRQGGFKSANKKLLISSDNSQVPELVVELSIRKNLDPKRTHTQISGLREEINKSNHGLVEFELLRKSISKNKMMLEDERKQRREIDRTRFIVDDLGIDLVDFLSHVRDQKVSAYTSLMKKDKGLNILNQMTAEVKKLQVKSIVSYDLKLDNFLWDDQKEQLALIDLGTSEQNKAEIVNYPKGTLTSESQTSFSMHYGGYASTADDALGMLYTMKQTANVMGLSEIEIAIGLSIKLLIGIYADDLSIQTRKDINQFSQVRRRVGLERLDIYQFNNIDNVLRLVNIAQILGLNPTNDEQNRLTIDMLYKIYRLLLETKELSKIPTRLNSGHDVRLETFLMNHVKIINIAKILNLKLEDPQDRRKAFAIYRTLGKSEQLEIIPTGLSFKDHDKLKAILRIYLIEISETMDRRAQETLQEMITNRTIIKLVDDIINGDSEKLDTTLSNLGEAVQVIIKKPILLTFAIQRNQVECMQVLIKHGANITELDNSSRNALHYAAFYGHTNLVKQLTEQYPQLVNERDANRKRALEIGRDRGHKDVIDVLEKAITEKKQHVKHLQHPQNRLNASMKDLEAFGKRKRDNGKKDMEEKDMEEKDMERENKKPST